MERLNEVRVIGNVGKIIEKDKSTYISVALNESYKPKDSDEWVANTVWVDVISFGPVCDKIGKANIKVGDAILVIGKLGSRTYEEKRYTQIVAQKIQVVERKPETTENVPDESPLDENPKTNNEDDLPF